MRGKLVVPCPSRSTILADMLQPSWSNAAYILNEVKNPVRTLKIAGPLAVTTCGLLYIFANISYYAAATPAEVSASGVTVASFFMLKVFGKTASRVLR